MKLVIVVVLLFAISIPFAEGRILFRDDFNSNTLITSYDVRPDCYNKGGIRIEGGALIISWGYLIAPLPQFDPLRLFFFCYLLTLLTECNILIKGRFKILTNTRERLYLSWRAAGLDGCLDNLSQNSLQCIWGVNFNGISCVNRQTPGPSLSNFGKLFPKCMFSIQTLVSVGSVALNIGTEVEFMLADYGNRMSYNITDVSNGNTSTYNAEILPGSSLNNYVVLTNFPSENGAATPANSSFDFIEISTPDFVS